MTAIAVRAQIARLVLGSTRSATVGEFTLRSVQRHTLRAVRAAISEFGGALLADPPGTGKTVLALAAAHGAGRVLVIAPAALRAQWLAAAARASVPVAFMSLEALSRGHSRTASEFVIVDEAHHLRTPATRRYREAAAACVGAQVLLLSATPVVNREADRDALLALFMGARATRLSPSELGRCVIRRRDAAAVRPALRRLGPISVQADIDGVATALAQLPPPVPIAAGAPATALIVMTLAMAWQSSLAALDAALRRREQRGAALIDLLRAGCLPSPEALRHWVLHDDATQLALPLLVAAAAGESAPTAAGAVLAAVERHLSAVAVLRRLIRPHRADDASRRARALIDMLAGHPGRRVVVFARHAETVRALRHALRGEAGVVAIVGSRVQAASGRWSRDEVLRAIGPRARPYDPRDPRAIRLLLSTDALAEGVEMQGVDVVVHADLPWTPARLEQRVGRVVRVGSGAREVLEAWFPAPHEARALVRIGARLARKSRSRRRSVREGAAQGEIVELLEAWAAGSPERMGRAEEVLGRPGRGVAAWSIAPCDGFVSVLFEPEGARLVCGVHDGTRWRVSSSPRRVLRLLRSIGESGPCGGAPVSAREGQGDPGAFTVRRVRRLLARVLARRRALGTSGITSDSAPGSLGARRVARVRERLARVLERAPALVRPVLADRHEQLMRAFVSPLEGAREERIDDLLRAEPDDAAFARRLGALLRDRTDRASAASAPGAVHDRARDEARTAPILLLRRASAPPAATAGAPPSASTGNAATR